METGNAEVRSAHAKKGELEMKLRWIAVSFFFAVAAAAQMEPTSAKFMQVMEASMTQMDRGMAAAPMNNNIDHDFVTMMLPHHQGAIDMAKAELSYGKDPVMRRLAEEIIVDQESEIDAMHLWLKKNAASTTKEK
jgi:uncharacterized protein (DUF305 family)